MNDTLEIVFEDVHQQDAIELLLHILSHADKTVDVYFSKEGLEIFVSSVAKDELMAAFEADENVAAFFKVNGLHFGEAKIYSSLIRLVKYGGKYDVDFSFDGGAAAEVRTLMKGLHNEAKSIAQKFNVTSFFGGLEPASDNETQYFHNECEGPLMTA